MSVATVLDHGFQALKIRELASA